VIRTSGGSKRNSVLCRAEEFSPPLGSSNIFSIDRGPRVDRMISATAYMWAALYVISTECSSTVLNSVSLTHLGRCYISMLRLLATLTLCLLLKNTKVRHRVRVLGKTPEQSHWCSATGAISQTKNAVPTTFCLLLRRVVVGRGKYMQVCRT
jgi:hypothetical protein